MPVSTVHDVVERHCTCPITQELMEHPALVANGNTFERDKIAAWLTQNDTDPNTRERLAHRNLIPNLAVAHLVSGLRRPATMDLLCHTARQCLCPITGALMNTPATSRYGNTYDQEALREHLAQSATDWLTNLPLGPEDVVPNHTLARMIRELQPEFEGAVQRHPSIVFWHITALHMQHWLAIVRPRGVRSVAAMLSVSVGALLVRHAPNFASWGVPTGPLAAWGRAPLLGGLVLGSLAAPLGRVAALGGVAAGSVLAPPLLHGVAGARAVLAGSPVAIQEELARGLAEVGMVLLGLRLGTSGMRALSESAVPTFGCEPRTAIAALLFGGAVSLVGADLLGNLHPVCACALTAAAATVGASFFARLLVPAWRSSATPQNIR